MIGSNGIVPRSNDSGGGYSDLLEDVGDDGCFPVPDGAGLGVSYDWDLIERCRTAHHVFP